MWCTVVGTVRSMCLWDQGALPIGSNVMDTEAFDFVLGTTSSSSTPRFYPSLYKHPTSSTGPW